MEFHMLSGLRVATAIVIGLVISTLIGTFFGGLSLKGVTIGGIAFAGALLIITSMIQGGAPILRRKSTHRT
jgi:hypothetical protein